MLGLTTRQVRSSLRLRIVLVGATLLILAGTTGALGAVALFTQNGPFTGCLSTKGALYNVAQSGSTPLHSCATGDHKVTFSNAQGSRARPARPAWA
jgi:hypothetical protein